MSQCASSPGLGEDSRPLALPVYSIELYTRDTVSIAPSRCAPCKRTSKAVHVDQMILLSSDRVRAKWCALCPYSPELIVYIENLLSATPCRTR
jgi:hypothetical protein